MANRNFKNASFSNAADVVRLFSSFSIGAAGAVSGVVGDFLSASKTATGRYKITLEDRYNRLLGFSASLRSDIEATAATALTGVSSTQTLTFPAKAGATAGDYVVLFDTTGTAWAISLDVAGTDPEPTGAGWVAVAGARRVHVDISGTTDAASVAAAVEAAFDALTDVPFATSDGAADGTMTFIPTIRGPVVAAVPHNADDSDVGSITVAQTVVGVASAVGVTPNTVTFTAHGWNTGRAVALTIGGGTLPGGLSATTYYVIVVDANTVKFATSLANAEAGTAVDITDQGTAGQTMTLTPAVPYGSGVFAVEMSTANPDAALQSATPELELAFYNATGALVQPANGTKVYAEIVLRNSSVAMKGE